VGAMRLGRFLQPGGDLPDGQRLPAFCGIAPLKTAQSRPREKSKFIKQFSAESAVQSRT